MIIKCERNKRIIHKDDITEKNDIEEMLDLVRRGDNGEILTTKEIKIYLKHLIANKNKYVDCLYKYKDLMDHNSNSLELFGLISGALTIVAIVLNIIGGLVELTFSNVLMYTFNFFVFGTVPLVSLFLGSKIIRKRIAIKKVENKIKDLKNALDLEESDKLNKSLAELKDMILASISPSKRYSNDAFVANIQKDIETILEIKYPGYIADLEKLYSLTERYVDSKIAKKTTAPIDVLSSKKWFTELLEIESKFLAFNQNNKLQKDQSDIINALKEMRAALESEKIDSRTVVEIQSSGYKPTLKL